MSESLFARVRRIVSANVHEAVESMEKAQAEIVLKEAVREVERAIADVRAELGKELAKGHHAKRQLEMTKTKIAEFGDKSVFAVNENRDDLAEAAIARQLDLEAQIPVLNSAIEEAAAAQAKLEEFIAALEGRMREMQADIAAFQEARKQAQVDEPAQAMKTGAERASRAEAAFDRAMQSASGIAAPAKVAPDTSAKLAELDRIARAKTVAERLDAAKAMRKTA